MKGGADGGDGADGLTLLSADGLPEGWPEATVSLSGWEGVGDDEDVGGLPERYRLRGAIGSGGMGVVRRALDTRLDREVAIKLLHPHLRGAEPYRARFMAEARATAQLSHPGIVAVHDVGVLDDGRLWFAMRIVEGQTLGQVLRGAPLRRGIRILHQAAEAVAYAHSQGVVHRDLKPDNIMVGPFGEVLILDWGLARVLAQPEAPLGSGAPTVAAGGQLTQHGEVIGTPAYMSPAQAKGEAVGPETDVYALGALLFEILTGRAPFGGSNPMVVLGAVLRGERRPMTGEGPIPPALASLCDRAMGQGEPIHGGAAGFARALEGWLDGAERRAEALRRVAEADALAARMGALGEEAKEERRAAEATLDALPSWAPVEEKAGAWAREARALTLEREAHLAELGYTHALHSALSQDPDLPEAHARLADHYHARHVQAEAAFKEEEAVRLEFLLRRHDRGRYTDYLSGAGALTLHTDPPGAHATLFEWRPAGRRLVAQRVRELGRTPIDALPLPMGSYLVRLSAEGREVVDYPVYIARGAHWHGRPPGADAPRPIPIPPRGSLADGDVFVPGGWFYAGGDPDALNAMRGQEVWVDDFVIRRFPVTVGEYFAFLNDLVARGDEARALTLAPRDRAGLPEEGGPGLFTRDARGRFSPAAIREGADPLPDWPILLVDHDCAVAYAAWLSAREGVQWRLPWELEWEKAARGADRRLFPWGNGIDPALANVNGSLEGPPLPGPVSGFPTDASPYGVQGLGGNVRDWCADLYRPGGPHVTPDGRFVPALQPQWDGVGEALRALRGGAYPYYEKGTRICLRGCFASYLRGSIMGFRLARAV